MLRFAASILLCVAMIVATLSSALAHRPYFTQVERIVLPDGKTGELRIVNGDGIFGPDPQALLVLDSENRVIARSPQSFRLHITCRRPTDCKVFDLDDNSVLQLDPSTFHAAYVAEDFERKAPSEWWMTFYDQRGSWGIRSRKATWAELTTVNWSLLKATWPIFGFVMIVGFGAGFFRVILRSEKSSPLRSFLVRAFILLLRAIFFGVFAFVALMAMFVFNWTGNLWLVAFFLGIALSALFTRIIDRRAERMEIAA